jgi:hypothetical protein
MPVMVVENRAFGNRAYCTINEGLGKVMRFGGNDAEVLARLALAARRTRPCARRRCAQRGGIALKPLIARGLSMGDEMHQRNVACTGLLCASSRPRSPAPPSDATKLADALAFIAGNDQFFLNVAMAMGKAITDPARDVSARPSSPRCAATAPTSAFASAAPATAGSSRRLRCRRGSISPASPSRRQPGHGRFHDRRDRRPRRLRDGGGARRGRLRRRRRPRMRPLHPAMREITVGREPGMDDPRRSTSAGVPTGIDVRRVVETGIVPTINTGIAHRKPGIGQVGAGVVKAPLACFVQALRAAARQMERA